MVDAITDIQSLGSSAGDKIFSFFAYFVLFICAVIIAAILFFLVRRLLRYRIPVTIFEGEFKDGVFNLLYITKDKAGIFFDRVTKNRLFFLKKNRVGMNPDKVPYQKTPKGRMVFLIRYGFKNYAFTNPTVTNPAINFPIGDEDLNWALNAYERGKKVFTNSLFFQLIPYIGLIILGFFMLVIFVWLFRKLDILADVAVQMNEAAKELAKAKAGTIVSGG